MSRPPRLATMLLRRVTPEALRPFLVADLSDRYAVYRKRSRVRADLWFWRQTLSAWAWNLPGPAGVETGSLIRAASTDIRAALRSLRRRPAQSLAAAVTLALGIGASTTAFSVLYGTVLRGLPFEEADRLVHFERANLSEGRGSMAVTPHDYAEWRSTQQSFEDLGAYVEVAATIPVEGAPPERYVGVRVSANTFPLLRVQPAMGRTFSEADETVGAPRVVVLSHGLWSGRFASDPQIVGREIRLDGGPTTVIGVMPRGFGFPIAEQLWLPLRIDLESVERGRGRLDVFGRLVPGVTFEQASSEFTRISTRLQEAYPESNRGIAASLSTFHDEYIGEEFTRTTVRMLLGALLMLLVCCANVACLLLVRAVARQSDLAVRLSLGATPGRLIRLLLAEAGVVALVGGVLGVSIAWLGVEWFDRAGAQAGVFALPHGSDSLFWWEVGLDGPTLAFVLSVTAGTALVSGLAPAVVAARGGQRRALTTRSGSLGAGARRFADGLVILQLALTTGLLVAAGLVSRSGLNLAVADNAIDATGVYVARSALPQSGGRFAELEAQLDFAERLSEALRAEAGVEHAAVASALPLTVPTSWPILLGGSEGSDDPPEAGVVSVEPGYFATFGVSVAEGRLFLPSDRAGATPVAIVNRSFVRRLLPTEGTAIGQRVRLQDDEGAEPWLTIVGVVDDLWDRPLQPDREIGIYLPLAQAAMGDPRLRLGYLELLYPTVAVRTRAGAQDVGGTVRRTVVRIDPTVPVDQVRSADEVLGQQLGRYRVWGRFYLVFAAIGTLLASIGLFGVLSFQVARRAPEIGVRRALGASAAGVRLQMLAVAGRQVLVGAGVGLLLGWSFAGGLSHVLFGVDPQDPVVFASVTVVVLLVGLVASWVPARRAAALDPVAAIRAE